MLLKFCCLTTYLEKVSKWERERKLIGYQNQICWGTYISHDLYSTFSFSKVLPLFSLPFFWKSLCYWEALALPLKPIQPYDAISKVNYYGEFFAFGLHICYSATVAQ